MTYRICVMSKTISLETNSCVRWKAYYVWLGKGMKALLWNARLRPRTHAAKDYGVEWENDKLPLDAMMDFCKNRGKHPTPKR